MGTMKRTKKELKVQSSQKIRNSLTTFLLLNNADALKCCLLVRVIPMRMEIIIMATSMQHSLSEKGKKN